MATTVQPLTGTYELDPHHSTVQFAVRHQQVSTFRASFAEVDVSLNADGGSSPSRLSSRRNSASTSSAEPTSSTPTCTP